METLNELIERCPKLRNCQDSIAAAAELLTDVFRQGGKMLLCGNGGSSADADHIVGELAKGFLKKRPVTGDLRDRLNDCAGRDNFADRLQMGLPALSLHSQSALLTAFCNDADPEMMYAQAALALGRAGDALFAISTSGNAQNVVNAAVTAKALGMKVVALTGENPCRLDPLADVAIHVGEHETYRVQELHLPVYHWIAAKLEDTFFKD